MNRRAGAFLRRRDVAQRRVGHEVIIARPADGDAVILNATAAVMWDELEQWTTSDAMIANVGRRFPDISPSEVRSGIEIALEQLVADDLIEVETTDHVGH